MITISTTNDQRESSDALMNGSSKGNIIISPNPVTGNVLNLRIVNANTTNVQVTIPKGMYILKVINNKNEQQQMKFVKAN
jgi:hypothetical protein